MARPSKPTIPLPEAVALRRMISVQEAASLVALHEDTFRKHFPHLIKRVGPRLDRVTLGDALAIGQSKTA
jgi:hypothetical protein